MPPIEIDELRMKLDALDLTGRKIIPFKGLPLMEKAFFPGGNGLFKGSMANVPVKGTLILGSNFGCIADFVRENGTLVRTDETDASKTWVGRKPGFGLKTMFARTPIRLEECFFTNAWPFLHEGSSNNASKLIKQWLGDESLMNDCIEFFKTSVSKVKPKLVVALGPSAAAFISKVWTHRFAEWGGCNIDSMDRKPVDTVLFESESIVCAAVTHPSAHDLNAMKRAEPFKSLSNSIDGEVRLLIRAANEAGISIGS
jgi:hypothetical protein